MAIVEAESGERLTYAALLDATERLAAALRNSNHDLLFLLASPSSSTAVSYLACRSAGLTVLVLDPAIRADALQSLLELYKPSGIIGISDAPATYRMEEAIDGQTTVMVATDRADNATTSGASVLLPTSGSTGNPKLVQLSESNLKTNAAAIALSLDMTPEDRGLASLPLFYSYGLSILNSHLAIGATTVLTAASPIRPEFWEIVKEFEVSSIPGVPYSYQMFRRAGQMKMHLPSLRYMTQAGGKLSDADVLDFHEWLDSAGRRLYVMYGQTEASPRMSVLPPSDLPEHVGSVGLPLAGGRFEIDEPGSDGSGEVLFDGPNVMLGYATSRADLGQRSQLGPLRTGDVGRLDSDGRLNITGRLKRIAKLFGERINLDDVERRFDGLGPVAVIDGKDNKLVVFAERCSDELKKAAKTLERELRVPPRTVSVAVVEELPTNANGKIDYRSLNDGR